MEVAFPSSNKAAGKVVDLVPEIKKKKTRDRYRWDLTHEDLNRIAADIWPGVNGPAPEVTSVTGKAPKKPSLSYQAKHALQEIVSDVESIKYKMQHLNEHGLKGLEFEARRTATFEDPHLWTAVAEEARLQREVLAAHRTGRGEWYAVLEATQIEDRIIAKTMHVAHVKCASREDAVEVGKRLMVEKAEWLAPAVSLEIAIHSALEWQPDEE